MATLQMIDVGTESGAGDGTNAVAAAGIINGNDVALNDELGALTTTVAGKAALADAVPTGLAGQVLGVEVDGATRSFQDPSALDLLTGEDGAQLHVRIDNLILETDTNFTALNDAIDAKAPAAVPILVEAGTTRTLALTDYGAMLRFTNASAVTLTIPLNSSVAWAIGQVVVLSQAGAGQVTVAPTGGVTLNHASGLKTRAQYSALSLIKVATDTWHVTGDATT